MTHGTCPECQQDGTLNRDHIIPRWLMKAMYNFGFKPDDVLLKAGLLGKRITQPMCIACNGMKSGFLDWKDPLVRQYIKTFLLMCEEELDRREAPVQVLVVCKCKECEAITKWEDRAVKTAEIVQEVVALHAGLSIAKEPHEIEKKDIRRYGK